MSRKALRRLLMLALIVTCSVVLVFILFHDRVPLPETVLDRTVMDADVALRKFNYTESEHGVALWTLTADSAAHDLGTETTAMHNVQLEMFNQAQAGDVVLTAKSGIAELASQRIQVAGDVVITTGNGYRFSTDSLTFQGNSSTQGLVSTDDVVHVRSEQLTLTGSGMLLDLGRGTLKLHHQVSATCFPQAIKEGS